MKLSEQRELFPPTWHTLPIGASIWFRYTASQWMRARVVFSCRKNLVVEPLAGELRRTMALRWSEIFWQPGDLPAPDRLVVRRPRSRPAAPLSLPHIVVCRRCGRLHQGENAAEPLSCEAI